MLEHADRYDAVESALDVAVILQLELRVAARPFSAARSLAMCVLLLRQRDAGHVGAGDFREVKPEAAPAAADVEDAQGALALRQQFGGEMPLLGELGVVERLLGTFEIAAAVLPVGVEEQRVKPSIEIVVMSDVLPRASTRIELLQAAVKIAQQPLRPRPMRDRRNVCPSAIASTSAIEPSSTTNVPFM